MPWIARRSVVRPESPGLAGPVSGGHKSLPDDLDKVGNALPGPGTDPHVGLGPGFMALQKIRPEAHTNDPGWIIPCVLCRSHPGGRGVVHAPGVYPACMAVPAPEDEVAV